MRIDNLPDPGNRFILKGEIGNGVCAKVFKAIDNEAGLRPVAIKIQKYKADLKEHIKEEYRILRDFSKHANVPELFGVYKRETEDGATEVWFVMEVGQITFLNIVKCAINVQYISKIFLRNDFTCIKGR